MMTESSMIKFSLKQEISSLCRMRDTVNSFLKKDPDLHIGDGKMTFL